MKWVLAAAFFIFELQGLPPLVAPLVPDSGGVVTGVVRRADSGQPITEARVAVVAEGQSIEQAMVRAIVTDVNGRFTIRGIEPAAYTVVVQAEGYFGATGQADAATRTTKSIQLAEGQQIDVGVVKLVAGSIISGRVAGPDGAPVAAATVEALKASYIRGRLAFTPVKSAKANDLGEYRLYWLPPGAYYIRGMFRSNAEAALERYGRVFFPGIPEEDAAPPVFVSSGSELSGIDVRVPIVPTKGFTISGQVIGDQADGDSRVTSVYVIPRDRRVLLVDDPVDVFANLSPNAAKGFFEIRNVPPGEYTLTLLVRRDGRIRPVFIPVDVVDRDIANISETIPPAFDVSGRVTLEGRAPGATVLKDSIQLVPTEAIPEIDSYAISPNPQTGEFTIPALPVGKYAIRLGGAFGSYDTWVSDVNRGEASVFDSGLSVGGNLKEPLEVVLKSRGGVLSGTITDPTRLRPFPYATVVLIPAKSRRQNLALYKHSLSGEDGSFVFTGIPPGEYKLFAWASVIPGAWENAIFLQRFETRGAEVTIVDDSPKRVELTVIP